MTDLWVPYSDAPPMAVIEPGRHNVGVVVPRRRRGHTRMALETATFASARKARDAYWERFSGSREEHRRALSVGAHTLSRLACLLHRRGEDGFCSYGVASAGSFTSSGASPQTAIGVGTVGVTDFIVLFLGYSIWLGGSAGATGAPARLFACTYATNPPGTNSTTEAPFQRDGRVIAATNITGAQNWTVEPTVKSYLDTLGDLQPFGGGQRFDDSPDMSRAPDFALASGYGIEVNTGAAVAETASTIFCRN